LTVLFKKILALKNTLPHDKEVREVQTPTLDGRKQWSQNV
jgi:hypothetical protein